MTAKTIRVSEMAYLLYFLALFGAKSLGLYEGMLLYNISLVLGVLLFAVKVVLTNHTVLEYLCITILLGISLLVYKNTGEKGLLLYMTMMLGMKGVSLIRIEKWALVIVTFCFTLLTLLSITGLIDGKTTLSGNRLLAGSMLRHYLGYPNCNVTHTVFVILMMLLFLVVEYNGGKMTLSGIAFLCLMDIYIYIYTVSNTGLIASVVFILAYFILNRRQEISKMLGGAILLLYPLCMFISIGLPMLVTGDLFWKLDGILHNRMNYPHYWLTHEPITMFGVRFGEAPNSDYYIDSSFLYSFLQLGVVPCIILTALMMGMIYSLIKNKRKTELAVVVGLCVLGLSDPFFYNLAYKNILFLFIGDLFFKWIADFSRHLPDFFSKEICIIKIGMKEVDYGNSGVYKIWNKIETFLGNVFTVKGSRHLIVFACVMAIVGIIAFFVVTPGAVVGAIDTLEEWEYFRKVLSMGVWVAMAVMLVTTRIDIAKVEK